MAEKIKTLQPLRGLIVQEYGSQANFARALRWSDAVLSYKLCNPAAITVIDAVTMAKLLGFDLNSDSIALFLPS